MATTATFYAYAAGRNAITIGVLPDSNYPYYRVHVRPESSTTEVYRDWLDSSLTVTVDGLVEGTSYVINVGYATATNKTNEQVTGYIGAQTVATEGDAYRFIVTYDANGGSGAPSSETYTSTSSSMYITLSTTVPVRSGYTFLGWSKVSNATEATYVAGGSYSFYYGETYLYAVWTTSSSGGGGSSGGSGNGTVYIWGTDGKWHQAIAYVWGTDGEWHETIPYVWGTDGEWHEIGG